MDGTPTEIDLAYAAGVIDSDGSICVCRRPRKNGRPTFVLRVDVTMISEEVPMWFLATFGGFLLKDRPKTNLNPNNARFTPVWRWRVHCKKAFVFLRLVVPYLKLKKLRGELAIKLQETRDFYPGRSVPIPEDILTEQARLATLIREENRKTNSRISFIAKEIN